MGRGVLGDVWWDMVGNHMETYGESAKSPNRRKGMGAELLEKGWVKNKGTEEETQ